MSYIYYLQLHLRSAKRITRNKTVIFLLTYLLCLCRSGRLLSVEPLLAAPRRCMKRGRYQPVHHVRYLAAIHPSDVTLPWLAGLATCKDAAPKRAPHGQATLFLTSGHVTRPGSYCLPHDGSSTLAGGVRCETVWCVVCVLGIPCEVQPN